MVDIGALERGLIGSQALLISRCRDDLAHHTARSAALRNDIPLIRTGCIAPVHVSRAQSSRNDPAIQVNNIWPQH
ncbi:hypothetical protein ACT4MK_46825 [Bradyrhizobium barranii]|uniref:hypothetical protein n=1 Tax=Bradyrhizobium TaxID=374 RepID=UPI003F1FEFA0